MVRQGRLLHLTSLRPVFKDPRDGATTPDASLATVRRRDGTPLPAEQSFVEEFTSLQQTGDWPQP